MENETPVDGQAPVATSAEGAAVNATQTTAQPAVSESTSPAETTSVTAQAQPAPTEAPTAPETPAAAVETAPVETAPVETPAATDAAHGTDAAAGELHTSTEHAADHGGAFPPFDPATFGTQLIWLAITFAVLYVLMSRVALPRIGSILADRKARIDGDLAKADAAQQKTDAAIAAYEQALAAARAKSQAIAEETRSAIKADIDGKRHAVEADLSRKVAEAEARIQANKSEALSHVNEIAADTVQALVTQLTGSASADEARNAVATAAKE